MRPVPLRLRPAPSEVAHPDAWDDRRLLDIRNRPGERAFIVGNHDVDREALRAAGFTT